MLGKLKKNGLSGAPVSTENVNNQRTYKHHAHKPRVLGQQACVVVATSRVCFYHIVRNCTFPCYDV